MQTLSPPEKTLSLRLTQTHPRQHLVTTPVQLFYQFSSDVEQNVILDKRLEPANDFINSMQDIVIDGQNLTEKLSWRGVSLLQFIPSYIWPYVLRTSGLVSALDQIMSGTEATRVVFSPVGDHTEFIWQGAVESVAKAHNIPCQSTGAPLKKRAFQDRSSAAFWKHLMPLQTLHKLVKRSPSRSLGTHNRRLLFASQTRHWNQGPDGTWYDEQFEPVLKALGNSEWDSFIGIDCPYSPRCRSIGSLWRREVKPDTQWYGFYSESSLGELRREYNDARRHFREVWNTLRTHPDFHKQFGRNGISFLTPLQASLDRVFTTTLPTCSAMLVAAANLIDVHQPDAIAVTYEAGPFQRALLVEATRRTIPTLALSHSIIFESNYDYMHKGVAPSLDAPFIIPDVTCVWGPLSHRSLTASGNYPETAVTITGSWRHDITEDAPDSNQHKPSNVDIRRPRILILSAGQRVAEYVETVLASLPTPCEAVVRLHPADDPEPVLQLLRRIGAESCYQQGGPLSDQLAQTDIVVSQWSTAASEAVLQGIPTILADLWNFPGYEAYVEHGACLVARTAEDLKDAVSAVINDTAVRDQLSENQDRLIREFYHHLDGKCGERVISALDQLIKNQEVPIHYTSPRHERSQAVA
ncbi:MAG: hypothetical protein VX910_06115 [Candidatus Latescibacterota bacterium]|nr:hypothetical protein [Candidatus Latescibacterota bacterium]